MKKEHLLQYKNKDCCFRVRVYNGRCAGLYNKKFEGTEYSPYIGGIFLAKFHYRPDEL
jgi:hypothetical protein